jgi:cytochrome c556
MMIIRTVLIAATVAVGVTGVVAQTDVIGQRKQLMKQNSQHTKSINAMVKGDAAFDAKAVNAAFSQWADTAAQLPKLFPDNSKTGDTRALPKIWSDRAGFDAQVASFAKASAPRPANIEELKKAFSAVGKSCGDCHEGFRAAAKK